MSKIIRCSAREKRRNCNIDDLMPHASGHTYTADTPMGIQHKDDSTASATDLAWLADASQEPETFDGKSWAAFPVGSLYPFGDPKPADVNQHVIGDCCACAVMASIAHLYSWPMATSWVQLLERPIKSLGPL